MAAKVYFFTAKGVLEGTSSLYGASSAYKIETRLFYDKFTDFV
jgi:hypothetical protein